MSDQSKARNITVLSVDDEEMNNDLIRRVFRTRAQYVLHVATSGQEALDVVQNEHVEILLVDQSMPGMTGVQFLEQAKSIRPEAVCIMVTGYPELDDVVQALDRGLVSHVIVKPWRPEDLISAVDRAVAMQQMQQAVGRLDSRIKK